MDALKKSVRNFVHSLPSSAIVTPPNLPLPHISKLGATETGATVVVEQGSLDIEKRGILQSITKSLSKAIRTGEDKVGLLSGMCEAVRSRLLTRQSERY